MHNAFWNKYSNTDQKTTTKPKKHYLHKWANIRLEENTALYSDNERVFNRTKLQQQMQEIINVN